jgi:hypothetical protein
LRELIVYQSPPELGSLWSDVNKMMEELGKQEEVLIARKMRMEAADAVRRAKFMRSLQADAYFGGLILFLILVMSCVFAYIAHDAEKRYPGLMEHTNQFKYEEIRKRELLSAIEKLKNPSTYSEKD